MSPGGIFLRILLAVSIYGLLGSGNDYATDIPGINQQVVAKWFPVGGGNEITSVCNLSSLNITIKPRVPWRGSDILLEWTLETGCNLIISWIFDHSKFVTQWFKGNVGSGNIMIPCSYSSTTTIISVFALTYISNGTNIFPSTESRHVPVKCYSLDDFYVEFDKFIPSTKVPIFKVGVNGTKDYLNENIMLEWLWGDTIKEVCSFIKSTFSHNYNENGHFRASLILKDKAYSRTINIIFYRGDLKFSVNTINGNISSTVFKFYVLDFSGHILSNFSRKYDYAGAYTVTFGYACPTCNEIIMIDNAMVGIQITVDNPIESLVIETNNRTRYPPAELTLNISVPSNHLPVQNMKCVLDMDDFIDRKTYSIFSPKVTSELKITFNYTYLTLGDHYIRVSCESFASRKESIQKVTVYHDCLFQGGCFDFQYSGEDTALNTNLNFEMEIGNRKEVRYDNLPIYTWTIEERLLNGSYSLTENMTRNSDNFPIQANTHREGLYRLNLKIEFQFSKCDYYQEFTYIKFNRVPLRQNANDSTRIDCLYNCFERVATRHILHLRLNCLRCTKLTWTIPIVNDMNEMLNQIAHFGINNKSLIIRGGSLKPGTKYNIKVNFAIDNNISYIFTNFTTNISPSNGTCEVNPSIGFASETLYTISCAGWIDDDPYGIHYQYIFQSGDRNNTEHILYAAYENKSFSMHLPVGAKDDEYRAHILVRITDGFGDYTEYVLTVAIFPSKVVRDALDDNSSFTNVSAYLKLLKNNITVASLSGHITRSVRCIESAASNIALIPLPYQGITLLPDDLYLIGFYKDESEKKMSFTWESYWKDRVKPRDKRQQCVLTEMTSLMSTVSLQLCHQALTTRYKGTYTISSLASSMADLISGPDYVTEGVLVIECAEQLKTNLVAIASTYDYRLQNHENITLAAGGLVRLVSKMLKVVHPLLTAYFPQNRTVKVMRNFLQYAQEFFDFKIYENRTISLQEQTFIAMRELLRIELEKEEKKRIALKILPGWRSLLKGASYALDAISSIGHPEFLASNGLTVMSSNHWIKYVQHENIHVDSVLLNFSGSVLGSDTDGTLNISLVVFRDNPYYWGWNGERISSRVIEYVFNPEDAFQKLNVRISLPNERILKHKPTPYTDSEDNSTIKYLFYSFDRQYIEDDVLIFINASSEELLYDIYLNYDVRPTQLKNTYRTSVTKSDWTKDGFRIIIRAEYLQKTGAVHLAFVPHLEGTNTTDRPVVNLYVTSVHCYNWNGSDWDHRACKVSEESSLDTSICLCETTSPNFTAGTTFYFPLNIQAFDVPSVDHLYPGAYLILLPFSVAIFLYVIILIWACVIDSVDENVPHDSGSIRNYVMGVARHLGCLMSLNIWLDKSGVHDGSWFLRKVIVDDVHTGKRTIFNCNKWLSFNEEAGKTEGLFSSSTDEGVYSLRYRLSTNIPHYLAYINIWSSIFVRMHPSEFSRVGRVTGALILVTALMATILVLPQYASLTEETKTFIVGPLRFSLKNMYNALTSIVITVPVMYLLFAVLHKSNIQNKSCSPWRSVQRKILKLFYRDKLDCYLKSGDELDGCIFEKKTLLPAYCGALTWIVLLAIFCISVFYIITNTPLINKEDAEIWLTTFLIAIFVSILVFEPLMVLYLAILASLLGRLCDPRKPLAYINGLRSRNIWRCNFQSKYTVQANVLRSRLHKTQRAIRRLRQQMLLKSQTWFLIMEMLAYSVFFVVAYILALSSTDQRACELKEHLEKRLQFDKITGRTNFLEWMSSTFFNLYFPVKVYNTSDVPYELKYHFIDFTNIRVGPARLRQVRGKIETCSHSLSLTKTCIESYQITSEDTDDYDRGWNKSAYGREQVEKFTFTEWHYVNAIDIWGIPVTGQYNLKLYGGGGYIVKLDINRNVSEYIIQELMYHNWIDRGTRAIFLEFALYNPNANLFSFIMYIAEYPETGGLFNSSYITTFRLNHSGILYIGCYLLFVLFVILLFLRLCFDIYNSGTQYFAYLWNITDFCMFFLGIVSLVLLFYRHTMTNETMDRYLEDQNEYVNFEHLAVANSWLITLLAILLFYATLRIIRIQGRSKWFSRAIRTLQVAKRDLLGFLMTMVIIYSAYVSLGYGIFGRSLTIYKNPFAALITLTEALLGKSMFKDIASQSPILAGVYYMTFVFLVIFCLMSMATTILNETIEHVTREPRTSGKNALEDILFRRIIKFLRWLDQPKKTNITRFIGGGLSKRKWTEAKHRKASHIHDSDYPNNITAMASTNCSSSAFARI